MTSSELINKYEKRPHQHRLNRFLTYVYSTLFALCIYGLLFYLFKLDNSQLQKQSETKRGRAYIAFIQDTELNSYAHNIYSWGRVLDPTLMSIPNHKTGFSEVRQFDFTKPVEPLTPYAFDLPLITKEILPAIPFALGSQSILGVLQEYQQLKPQHYSLSKDSQVLYSDTTSIWTDTYGRRIEGVPSMSWPIPRAGLQKMNATFKVRVREMGGVIHIQLLQSSGFRTFDQQAIHHLRKVYQQQSSQKKLNAVVAEDARIDVEIQLIWQLNKDLFKQRKDWQFLYGTGNVRD
ncbi:hypothetical protein JYT61_01240 [bacterium AH-315-E10]|nr:hypothetical protein [bacterium AH-315-E10]